MLSETWELAEALQECGLTPEATHPRVKLPGKTTGPCLHVRLTAKGAVESVEPMTKDEWPGLWTIMEGNQNSFPVVRLSKPLVQLPHKHEIWKELGSGVNAGRQGNAADVVSALGQVWKEIDAGSLGIQVDTSLWLRMKQKALDLEECSSGGDPADGVIHEFARRFVAAMNDPLGFLRQVAETCVKNVLSGRTQEGGRQDVRLLIIGENPRSDARGRSQPATKIQVALGFRGDSLFAAGLYSHRIKTRLIAILPRKVVGREEKIERIPDSFSGKLEQRQAGAFPKVRLPVLNRDYPLFSMFSEAACNVRYGMTDSDAIPVSEFTASRMSNALAYVVADQRKGYTWRPVASGKFERRGGRAVEKKDLLIVYPEARPDIAERIADIFGNDEKTVDRLFDADTRTVCQALDGIARTRPTSRIKIIVISKVSEGQAQVVIAESPTTAEVVAAAQKWSGGVTKNLPNIKVPIRPTVKGESVAYHHSVTPFPDEVVRLLSKQWMSAGRRSSVIPSIGLGDVLHLMLRTQSKWEAARDRTMGLLLARLSPLLIGIGSALCQTREASWKEYPTSARRTALRAIAVIGILLDFHSRNREVYMASAAFQIGQFLKLADILHHDYCVVVRKGSIPSSLVGNALMPRALDNPRLAVADLADRLRVYAGWAKTAREPTTERGRIAVREAWKTLRRIEPLATQLANSPIVERCDHLMKAEMLLGYLADVRVIETEDKEEAHG